MSKHMFTYMYVRKNTDLPRQLLIICSYFNMYERVNVLHSIKCPVSTLYSHFNYVCFQKFFSSHGSF